MRWMIGLDLGARSHGALELAGWLHACASPPTQDFTAVHVLDSRLQRVLRTDQLNEILAQIDRDVAETIAGSAAAEAITTRRVVTAESPERGLEDALATEPCDGILIGRIAPAGGRQIVRLGRVARRMLRRLPRPVIVAPPDLSPAMIGKGAILLATDLDTYSVAAATFAGRLATELGRELVVVHVELGVEYVPTLLGEPLVMHTPPRRIPADVDDWARSVGLGEVRTRLAEGLLHENLFDLANIEDSPIIVCGSRGLDRLDRIFVSSAGGELARFSERPVAVVPAH